MKRSPRAPASELVARTAELVRDRARLERMLVASGPVFAAVAAAALGWMPAWLGVGVALAAVAWATSGFRGERGAEVEAARRIDGRLAAKDTMLTWTTTPEGARGDLWPVVEDRAGALASGVSPRRFANAFEWRRPVASVVLSLAALGLLALLVELRPTPPAAKLEEIAAHLDATARDAAGHALAAKLRALAKTLADPNASAEEKRQMAAEARAELEKQQKSQQQGNQGSSGGQGQQQKPANEQSGAGTQQGEKKGEKKGDEKGEGSSDGSDRQAAAKALGEIEKELAGESPGEKESQGEKQKSEQAKGGGVQGPTEGERAGEKPGESSGNQPAGKDAGGKSEQGEGEGGRQSGEKPEGQNAEQPEGQKPEGQGAGTGEGAGASKNPSPGEDGQKAERYYEPGQGPDGLRIEDGGFVKVLVPEAGGGVGTERVQKPGEVAPETPFGNAPLPSEGPPGEADERQPLPLEYRPILRP